MFSTPESAKISDTWTAVQILGADDMTEEGERFMIRYGVQGFPTLMAVTAGGDLVDEDLFDGQFRDADYLFSAMQKANEANDAFLADRDRWLASGKAEDLQALAKAWTMRRNPQRAREVLERAVASEPSAASYVALVDVLRILRDVEAEKGALDAMIQRFAGHPDRVEWRVRRATLDVKQPADAAARGPFLEGIREALEGLRQETEAEGDKTAEASVRVRLADLERALGNEEASREHLDWVFANAPDAPAALDAHLLLAQAGLQAQDADAVRENAQWVLDHAPESPQAVRAHMVLGDMAFGTQDFEAMEKHFQAVLKLAPDSPAAVEAKRVLDFLERRRARDR